MSKMVQWWNDHKNEARKTEMNNITSDFKVVERNGKVFLTHQGYAFAEVAKDASVSVIVNKLNEARKAALEFEGYGN